MLKEAVWLALLGGSGIFVGALAASFEHIRPQWLENEFRHGITAFGGGALISAVALVLVPDGIEQQPVWSVLLTFLSGGLVFMMFDRFLAHRRTPAAQFVAMLLDFVPEAMVIGAVIAGNRDEAFLLALVIFIQNVPESFNSFCEIRNFSNGGNVKLLCGFFAVGCTGPVYVLAGTLVLSGHEPLLAGLMTFCAGGILYIIFNDIAPQVKLKQHWLPPMGALLGFMAGILGKLFIR